MHRIPTTQCAELDAAQLAAVMTIFRKRRRAIEPLSQGGSMGTAIPAGARIRIQCDAEPPYKRGEIIAFLVHNRIVVHRVVACGRHGRAKNYLITQGDATLLPDLPVHVEAVVGPVTAIQCEKGWEPPGKLTSASFRRRLLATVSRLILRSALELNVSLAQWLANKLRVLTSRWLKSGALLITLPEAVHLSLGLLGPGQGYQGGLPRPPGEDLSLPGGESFVE